MRGVHRKRNDKDAIDEDDEVDDANDSDKPQDQLIFAEEQDAVADLKGKSKMNKLFHRRT